MLQLHNITTIGRITSIWMITYLSPLRNRCATCESTNIMHQKWTLKIICYTADTCIVHRRSQSVKTENHFDFCSHSHSHTLQFTNTDTPGVLLSHSCSFPSVSTTLFFQAKIWDEDINPFCFVLMKTQKSC